MANFEEATSYHNSALHQVMSSIATRIRAGKGVLINCTKVFDWRQAYEASSHAVSLVPKVIPRALENSDKQYTLSQVTDLVSDTTATALNFNQLPLAALQLLKQRRNLPTTSANEMRVDILHLQEADPALAEKFIAAP